MKKFGWFVLCLSICSLSWGENLSFVTTMSGPVGSFSQVDATGKATATTVTLYNVGDIYLNAGSNYRTAKLGAVQVNDKTLKSDANAFKAQTLTLKQNGVLEASRLVTKSLQHEGNNGSGEILSTGVIKGTLYGANNLAQVQVNRLAVSSTSTASKLIIQPLNHYSQISYDPTRLPGDNLAWEQVPGINNKYFLRGAI